LKNYVISFCFAILASPVSGQQYIFKQGYINFFAKAPIQNIDADNRSPQVFFDMSTGVLRISLEMEAFEFDRPLMKEHFNEKYIHSEKYPRSTFNGKIQGYQGTIGSYDVTASGQMQIHGVTRTVSIDGRLVVKENTVTLSSSFPIVIADYNVESPKILFTKLAETVEGTVETILQEQE